LEGETTDLSGGWKMEKTGTSFGLENWRTVDVFWEWLPI
jgi:hypothetical protein